MSAVINPAPAVPLWKTSTRARAPRPCSGSAESPFLRGVGLPPLPARGSGKAVTLRAASRRSTARGVYTTASATGPAAPNGHVDPRDSPIYRMADPSCTEPPTAARAGHTNESITFQSVADGIAGAVSRLWSARKAFAAVAFAVVLALADAGPAMAGRSGGRSGGRMGGSSFRPSASRSMAGFFFFLPLLYSISECHTVTLSHCFIRAERAMRGEHHLKTR